MRKTFLTLIGTLTLTLLVSCATSNCKRKEKVPQMPNKSNVDKELKIDDNVQKPKTVFVFKYDGSLQCGMGQAIAVNEMAKQLDDVKIFSSMNRSDGQMRIQVCGSSTGQANIYEINANDLEKAIKLGFKLWKF